MPNRPFEELEAQVGDTVRTVTDLHIEAGKVQEFARSIHDPAPIYCDADAARDAGFDRIPVPPTFTRTSYFPRYRPEDIGFDLGFDLGFDRDYGLHGEQRYEFVRPIIVGDDLYGETTLEDIYQREGTVGGTMTFAVFRTDFYDRTATRVQSEWTTRIETGKVVENDADSTPVGEIDPSDADCGLDEGNVGPVVRTGPLERRDFVRYAGASGDFDPDHYNEPYAINAGHPSVFGQGMLSAGVLSGLVRRWVGLDALDEFQTRFTALVFPGESLIARGTVADVTETADGRKVGLNLEVVTNDNKKVVDGSATVTR